MFQDTLCQALGEHQINRCADKDPKGHDKQIVLDESGLDEAKHLRAAFDQRCDTIHRAINDSPVQQTRPIRVEPGEFAAAVHDSVNDGAIKRPEGVHGPHNRTDDKGMIELVHIVFVQQHLIRESILRGQPLSPFRIERVDVPSE